MMCEHGAQQCGAPTGELAVVPVIAKIQSNHSANLCLVPADTLGARPFACLIMTIGRRESPMYRMLFVLVLALAGFSAAGEEFVLKDGTKLVGKMTALTADKIEVETSYGKMQVKRTDLVSINFPENSVDPAKKELPKVDESLSGTAYVNRTGNFTLALPTGWKIKPSLKAGPDVLAGLSSNDDMRFLMLVQEQYTGSLDSYRGLVEIQARQNLDGYEKLSESKATYDGKPSLLLSYRGVSRKANNLPIQFLVAIIPDGKNFSRITAWCVEPLFNESQGTFEKIMQSYRQTGPATASAGKP